jgi:hypothetical protein
MTTYEFGWSKNDGKVSKSHPTLTCVLARGARRGFPLPSPLSSLPCEPCSAAF